MQMLRLLLPAVFAGSAVAQSSRGCTYTLRPSHGQYEQCGSHGTLARPQILRSERIPQATADPLTACAAHCFAKSNCVSFGYEKSTRQCHLYTGTIDSQELHKFRNGISYYNRHCFSQVCPTTSTIPPCAPTQAVSNGAFVALPGGSFDTAPPPWSFMGAMFENDCQQNPGPCFGDPNNDQTFAYTLLSSGADDNGAFSQPVELVPGSTYQFSLAAGYDDSVPCTVTYSLDSDTFRSFSPVNTNEMFEPDGPYAVTATAVNQTLMVYMICPTANDNSGVGLFTNVSLIGGC